MYISILYMSGFTRTGYLRRRGLEDIEKKKKMAKNIGSFIFYILFYIKGVRREGK